MFIRRGKRSPEIVTSLKPFFLLIDAKGSLLSILIISFSLKLTPVGVIILKSLIISVSCSLSDNFKRTVTSSSPLGNLEIIVPLIADLTCSPISKIDNPKDCPLFVKLKFFSWTPYSKLSSKEVAPGIVLAISINSFEANFKVSKFLPWNLTSRSLPGGPPLGDLIVNLSRPDTVSTFCFQTLINSFVLIFLLSAVTNSTTIEPRISLPIESEPAPFDINVLPLIVDILNFTNPGEVENWDEVLFRPFSIFSNIFLVWDFVEPECILKLAITISASGVGKKLNKTLPPDIMPIETTNIPIATIKVTYL